MRHANQGAYSQIPEFMIMNCRYGNPLDPLAGYTRRGLTLSAFIPTGAPRDTYLQLMVEKAVPGGDVSASLIYCRKNAAGAVDTGSPLIILEVEPRCTLHLLREGVSQKIFDEFDRAATTHNWHPIDVSNRRGPIVSDEPVPVEHLRWNCDR